MQTITKTGQAGVVVVSAAEWENKTRRRGRLADFFAELPLRNSGLVMERDGETAHEMEL